MTDTISTSETAAVLHALRRIIQAVDIHSRFLMQRTGLSMPQILVLQALAAHSQPLGTSALAAQLHLTQGTISAILERLERKALIRRDRSGPDRRRVQIQLTAQGFEVMKDAPQPLQAHFIAEYMALPDWERTALLSSLQRVASLMRAPESGPMLESDVRTVDPSTSLEAS